MKKVYYFIKLMLIAVVIFSCQKEVSVDNSGGNNGTGSGSGNGGGNSMGGGGNPALLKGDWKFISQEADIKSTVEYTVPGLGTKAKSVTFTKYTTLDNKGELKIDDSKMTFSGIVYRISTTSDVELYSNNVLVNKTSTPFEYTIPEYTNVCDYKVALPDSIRFINSTLSFAQGSTVSSESSGVKYLIEGNKLKLFSDRKETKTETEQGLTTKVTNEAKTIINCERK
ncbi:MAG: hypothetical protein QM764_11565 [Chitinophagaceae bacterium]